VRKDCGRRPGRGANLDISGKLKKPPQGILKGLETMVKAQPSRREKASGFNIYTRFIILFPWRSASAARGFCGLPRRATGLPAPTLETGPTVATEPTVATTVG